MTPESQSSLPPQRLTAKLIFIDLQRGWMSVCVVCVGSNWAGNPTHLPTGNTTRQKHLNESPSLSSSHSHSFSPVCNMYTHPLPFSPPPLSGIVVASSLTSSILHTTQTHTTVGSQRWHDSKARLLLLINLSTGLRFIFRCPFYSVITHKSSVNQSISVISKEPFTQ